MSSEIKLTLAIGFSDLACDLDARRYKKIATVQVRFAECAGLVNTLEGDVSFNIDDAILTGIAGERWPVKRNVFDERYELLGNQSSNTYRKRSKNPVFSKQIPIPFRIMIRGGEAILEGKAGDWLVQYAVDDAGIVDNEIFIQSYILYEE